MTKQVVIETRTTGDSFGTYAVVRDLRSRRKLAETTVVPYGFTGAAVERAEAIAANRGWRVVNAQGE